MTQPVRCYVDVSGVKVVVRIESTDLAPVAVDKHRVIGAVENYCESHAHPLWSNVDDAVLVGRNMNLNMTNAVLAHEHTVLGRQRLGNQGKYSLDSKTGDEIKVLLRGIAASIDMAVLDRSEVVRRDVHAQTIRYDSGAEFW